MGKRIIGIVLLCCGLLPASALAGPISGLTVFGDSLSDSGNNAAFFDRFRGGERTSVPLLPSDIISEVPYESDRYSNGPVWAEKFAAGLGLSAEPSRLGGTNYAHGGALTGPAGSGFPPSLLDQVDSFFADTGGSAPSDNLYVIAGGGNDARAALTEIFTTGDPAAATPFITDFGANIRSIVGSLHGAGATDFLIWNVADLGLTPAVRAEGDVAVRTATSIALAMNQLLDMVLNSLQRTLDIDILRFDAFDFGRAVVGNPQAYGLVNSTSACALYTECIRNPDGHFFWDGVHPTTAAHGIIAQQVLALVRGVVPAPGSLGLMAAGLLAIAWVGTRRRPRLPSPV